MTTSTQQLPDVPMLSNHIIDIPYCVDAPNVKGDSNYWAKSSGYYTITDSLTNSIDDLVNNYLRDNCYGITIKEVQSLIREHQPERLL